MKSLPGSRNHQDVYQSTHGKASLHVSQKKLRNISPQVMQKIIEFKKEKLPADHQNQLPKSLTRSTDEESRERKDSGSACSGAGTYMVGQRSQQALEKFRFISKSSLGRNALASSSSGKGLTKLKSIYMKK